jgi:hypothetical protein
MNPDQVGLLIVRVWVEPGSARPARLQLRATTDPSAGFTHTHTLTDIEQAITVIRAFLQTVLPSDTSSSRPDHGAVPPPHPGPPRAES